MSLEAVRWPPSMWSGRPAVWRDPARDDGEVKAVFYAGRPWRGRPTRVFAYYGVPRRPAGVKVPAIVLVHGGGGSAYVPWVRLWMDRGYAAIAMDTCGNVSGGGHRNHRRHEHAGPPGCGGLDQLDQPPADQWAYHAVADAVLAHSLIASFDQVDPTRIGVSGISWGGVIACLLAGVDQRLRFAVPVYGCGFLAENSGWLDSFRAVPAALVDRWRTWWDPAAHLRRADIPMLWVNGTNDVAFPMDSWQRSYGLPAGPATLCLRPRMAHGHGGPGERPAEIHAFADSVVRGGPPLARVLDQGCAGDRAWASFESRVPVVRAELHYAADGGSWQDRQWMAQEATLDHAAGTASGRLPPGAQLHYLNLIDERGLVVSSEHGSSEHGSSEHGSSEHRRRR